jgi:hypothetical protein
MELDHFLVPLRDKNASAKLLADILGVRWEPSGEGEPVPLDQPPPGGASDIDQQQWHQYRAQRSDWPL